MSLRIKALESMLLVVDIQQKLAPEMYNGEAAIEANYKLLQTVQQLGVPYMVTEQYPNGIGKTVEVLSPLINPVHVVEKMSFSSIAEDDIAAAIKEKGRNQVVVTGMETHVCVLQTVLDLIDAGYQVYVVEDCVASRTADNKRLGLERMRQCGAQIVSSEMVMFEWLGRGGTDDFKAILPLIK
ncbi:Nicotinamidase-like amidase [Candidatus Terasakiella magnetica]|uniref:Nicotinamidase-like amidase n=1 Tax=Candidatus Terasakiella magnetica TaxID=1867952 RepID=A0A1C3RBZ6_9PROT|nr:hydrolase [Candidatus Terasakiella magnetica]SCA54785.1 Nicotinamidase-like amidase [Candidatus Terasakiella magnetica]